MAKIKYLINNDPYASMVMAIKAENIMYGSFYHKFKECWGRLSLGYFGEVWDDELARTTVDGVEVFGHDRVILFSDSSVGYKWTKEFCKVVGADYEQLLDSRGDVSYFYVDLKGSHGTLDFTDEGVIQNAMNNIKAILQGYYIDSVQLSFVLDTAFDTWATDSLTLEELRLFRPQLDYNAGTYINSLLAPTVKCIGLPSGSFNGTAWSRVEGTEVAVSEEQLSLLLGSFGKYTTYLDACFNSINVSVETLPDREGFDGINIVYYHQYKYTISFNFDSTVSLTDGFVLNLVDWSHLTSTTFSTAFKDEYTTAKNYYDSTREDSGLGYNNFILSSEPAKDFIVLSSVISHLNTFSDLHNIFYSNGIAFGSFFLNRKTYLRFDRVADIPNREFGDLLFSSVHVTYKSKDSGGWFGGGFFGKILEMVFTIVVVVVGIVLAFYGCVYCLALAMAVLYVAAKYTGMSSSGQKMAGFGIKALGIVAIAFGIYDVYNIAYNTASNEAVLAAMAESQTTLSSAEVLVVLGEVGIGDVIAALGISGVASIAGNVYGAFNLLAPQNDKTAEQESVQSLEEKNAKSVYNINMAYDFYDDIYRIYD